MWIHDGVVRLHHSTVMELMEKKQSDATWKPWGEFGIIDGVTVLFVLCVCFSPCLVLYVSKYFPQCYLYFCFLQLFEIIVQVRWLLQLFVMPQKIHVRSFRSLRSHFFYCTCRRRHITLRWKILFSAPSDCQL